MGPYPIRIPLPHQYLALVSSAEPRRRLDQRVKHSLQIKCRAADDFEYIGGRRLLLMCFVAFLRSEVELGAQLSYQLRLIGAFRALRIRARRRLLAGPRAVSRRLISPHLIAVCYHISQLPGRLCGAANLAVQMSFRGHLRPIDDVCAMSVSPPTSDELLSRSKRLSGP